MEAERVPAICTKPEHTTILDRIVALETAFERLDIEFPSRKTELLVRDPEEFLVLLRIRQKKKDALIRDSRLLVAEAEASPSLKRFGGGPSPQVDNDTQRPSV